MMPLPGFSSFLGAGVGAALGYLAWRVARWCIGRYAPGEALPAPGVTIPSGVIPALGMAIWGGYVFWRVNDSRVIVAAMTATFLLTVIALVDYGAYRIPNELVGALLAWGAVQAVWLGHAALWAALFGTLMGGGAFMLLAWAGRGALGMGDVKFAAAEGALLGFPLILHGLLLGIVFGGLAAGLLLATRRAGRKDAFAYGPYLALGGWLIYLMTLHLLPCQL